MKELKPNREREQCMNNIFKEERPESHCIFTWDSLGDVEKGREHLGENMPVLVYRLLAFTMLDVLAKELGEDKAHELFIKAGFLAGKEFACNMLDLTQEFNGFVSQLQAVFRDMKIGILRIESFDEETKELVLTVGEDLDCSGLPVTGEVVCHYDEGFLEGLLYAYTGKEYHVEEIDCWAKGDRVCRFRGQARAIPGRK